MRNPAHTLIIHADADGNLEFKDLRTGTQGTVPAGERVRFITSSGRVLLVDVGLPTILEESTKEERS